MEIDLLAYEKRDSFLSWFVFHSINIDKIGEGGIKPGKDLYDLTMFIDGVELNPVAAIEALEKQMNAMINEKAVAMVENRFQNVIEELENTVKTATSQFKEELGIKDE